MVLRNLSLLVPFLFVNQLQFLHFVLAYLIMFLEYNPGCRHLAHKDNVFLAENIKKQYLCRKSKRVKSKKGRRYEHLAHTTQPKSIKTRI